MKRTDSQASLFREQLVRAEAQSIAATSTAGVDQVWSGFDFGSPMNFAGLKAQVEACERDVVQLFALIAQHCPEVLPGVWAALYDVVSAEERLWEYPSMTVGEYEDGVEPTAPFLSRQRLVREWSHLVEHAYRVHAARLTAERYRLSA